MMIKIALAVLSALVITHAQVHLGPEQPEMPPRPEPSSLRCVWVDTACHYDGDVHHCPMVEVCD